MVIMAKMTMTAMARVVMVKVRSLRGTFRQPPDTMVHMHVHPLRGGFPQVAASLGLVAASEGSHE